MPNGLGVTCTKLWSAITAGSTAISYAGGPAVRFRPVAVMPLPLMASHGGPYAVAIHGPEPAGSGSLTATGQGGFPAPANRTTGEITTRNAPAAEQPRRLAVPAATRIADERMPMIGHAAAPLAWRYRSCQLGVQSLSSAAHGSPAAVAQRGGAAGLVVLWVR